MVNEDRQFGDGFDYLENMDFAQINKVAEKATIEAHARGGVPCIEFETEEISEETFGSLYYIFMLSSNGIRISTSVPLGLLNRLCDAPKEQYIRLGLA